MRVSRRAESLRCRKRAHLDISNGSTELGFVGEQET